MKPGADFAREQKSPADADRPDRIELVRVKKDFGFERLGGGAFSIAMRLNAVDDAVDGFGGEAAALE